MQLPDRYRVISTSVSVVYNGVKCLIKPLPKNHLFWCPETDNHITTIMMLTYRKDGHKQCRHRSDYSYSGLAILSACFGSIFLAYLMKIYK